MPPSDPLERYRAKRDFARTAEPRGASGRRRGEPRFVIQKHHASRLHYDVRLEIDGVLVSWAVPKGPSTDPSVRRLAVRTEDHPLDYIAFEGVIPKGQYGGGTVLVWDTGTVVNRREVDLPTSLAEGRIEIALQGQKLQGDWLLVRMEDKDGQWLLIKRRGLGAESEQDLLVTRPDSVLSGRSLEQIAEDGQSSA